MVKKILLLLLSLTAFIPVYAQEGTSHLRISLLTCGPGDNEVWEVFGHSGVRVYDSANHSDIVYNYGTFEFGPDFELQFMRGKLLYCSAIQTYKEFMEEYVEAGRKVEEQVLLLDWKQTEHIDYFLRWNAEPENKYYKYDFFFDNCATRIRDIFPRPEVFGKNFHFGMALPKGKPVTFRDIINRYFYNFHWTRTGVNILLGSRIDKVMTNKDIMFLPDYLRDGLDGATVNGRKITGNKAVLLPGNPPPPTGIDGPLLLTISIAILTITGLSIKRLAILGKIMSMLLLFVTGLLGCLILVMWFGTDHQGCSSNFNILWCLPTNLVIAFFNPKGKGKYALVAMLLILVTLLLHVLGIQGLIIEFIPLLLVMFFIYGFIYRKSRIKKITGNA
jgi:hypothetical protein